MRLFQSMFSQAKLYSFTAPFALVPLMGFSISEIGDYLRGMEFRAVLAELLVQVTTGVVDAAMLAVIGTLFDAF